LKNAKNETALKHESMFCKNKSLLHVRITKTNSVYFSNKAASILWTSLHNNCCL